MITFRPHHFVCTVGFMGKGYSPDFVDNYQDIVNTLAAHPQTLIRVKEGQDSICGACPHRIDRTICNSQPIIDVLDDEYKELLEISDGDVVTWKEAQIRIQNNITIEDFHRICSICSWYKAGVCEKALKRLGVFRR
jgi:uncharacterized protein